MTRRKDALHSTQHSIVPERLITSTLQRYSSDREGEDAIDCCSIDKTKRYMIHKVEALQ